MKLTRKQMVMVSFMLFSMFFGAGNLIFPPFLGQTAGASTPGAVLGIIQLRHGYGDFLRYHAFCPMLQDFWGSVNAPSFDKLRPLCYYRENRKKE